jgi:hypothetical protein
MTISREKLLHELDTRSDEEYFLGMESPPRDERATSMS